MEQKSASLFPPTSHLASMQKEPQLVEDMMVRYTKAHLFHIRPVTSLVEETHESGHELKRAVGPLSLTALGVGAIVGRGSSSL
jgi:hypothetical protein